MTPQTAFIDLLLAAMKDAAIELKLTQLKAQIDPDGKGVRHVRIVVVPEQMEYERPDGKPFGTPPVGICPKCGAHMTHYRTKGYQCPHCN